MLQNISSIIKIFYNPPISSFSYHRSNQRTDQYHSSLEHKFRGNCPEKKKIICSVIPCLQVEICFCLFVTLQISDS